MFWILILKCRGFQILWSQITDLITVWKYEAIYMPWKWVLFLWIMGFIPGESCTAFTLPITYISSTFWCVWFLQQIKNKGTGSTYLTIIYWFTVNMCLSSYGCTLEVSNKARKKSLHVTPASWVQNPKCIHYSIDAQLKPWTNNYCFIT